MITKDPRTRSELVHQEVTGGRLGGSGGVIRSTSLFAKLTGCADRLTTEGVVIEAQSTFVEATAGGKTLDMRERQVAKPNVPLHPKLLYGCEVGVVLVEDGSEGAQSRDCRSLGEQNQTG